MATITDDFNRASLGANYTTLSGYTAMSISASTILIPGATSADCGSKYTASTLSTDDQYIQADITVNTSNSTNSVWLIYRAASGSTVTGYFVSMPRYGGNRQICKVVTNTVTVLAEESDGTPTGTRALRGEVIGSSLRLLIDSVEELQTTDTSITTGTYIGIVGYYEATGRWSMDNLEAGDLTREVADRPWVVSGADAAISASRSPSFTFIEAAAENDIVIAWPSSTTTATITEPSGWTNPLGAGVDVESDSHQICCVYHRVTAGEAGTTTWTLTNLYDANETGNVVAALVRGVDTTTAVDASNSTFSSTNTVTPHVLASITPNYTGSLILSAVAKDATGAYSSAPSGWTTITSSNSSQGKWLGQYDTATTASSGVGPTDITPSAGDEYASISVALKKAASGGATATPSTVACTTSIPSPTAGAGVGVTPSTVAAVVAVPSPTAAGNVAVTADVVSALASVPSPTASSGSTVTADVVAGLVALPPPTAGAGVGVTADVVAAVVTVPSPTAAGNVAVTTDVVAAVAAVPAPTVDAQTSVDVTADVVVAAVAVPAPTAAGNVTITADVVAAVAAVPSPTASAGVGVAADVVAAVVAVPAPAVTAGGDASVSADVVAAVVAVPSPTAGAGVGVTADVVAAVAAVPTPTAAGSVAVTADTVAAVVAVGSPTVATGAGASPSTVAAVVAVPDPSVSAAGNATATPSTVAAVVAVGSPTVTTGATASPATVAAVVAVGSPTVATGAGASPSTIAVTSSVPTPSITAGEVDPGAVVYVVPAETRVWVIPAETRTLVVRAETRKLVVPDGL